MKLFDDPENKVVVAISPQSISSLAQFAEGDFDDHTMFTKLQTFFMQLGATMVLDMSVFTAISLELAYQEFASRYQSVCEAKIEAFKATQQEDEE